MKESSGILQKRLPRSNMEGFFRGKTTGKAAMFWIGYKAARKPPIRKPPQRPETSCHDAAGSSKGINAIIFLPSCGIYPVASDYTPGLVRACFERIRLSDTIFRIQKRWGHPLKSIKPGEGWHEFTLSKKRKKPRGKSTGLCYLLSLSGSCFYIKRAPQSE